MQAIGKDLSKQGTINHEQVDCPLCWLLSHPLENHGDDKQPERLGEAAINLCETRNCRVILLREDDVPVCRVIWRDHVREMTDLTPEAQQELLRTVLAVERAMRQVYQPDKINLASLGNAVPHLHWHVIARWCDDRRFPLSIWGQPCRDTSERKPLITAEVAARLREALRGL